MNLFTVSDIKIEQYGFVNTFKNQNFIISYLHPLNPYRSLVICYEVGLGKTYASACLAHVYLSYGYKVLYLSSSLNSISNFRNEYNKVITDSRLTSYEKNIDVKSFSKFYNSEKKNENNEEYGLVIVDEVHNLRELAIRYKTIKNKLDSMINSKILIVTATPMIDSHKELDSIINLTNEKTKIIFSENKISKDVKINYVGSNINGETLFLSRMKGKQLEDYYKSLKNKNDTVYTETRQASISWNDEFNPEIPLDEQSSKISRVIETLKDGELTVIFCFYVKRGIDFMAKVLEHFGYRKWDPLYNGKSYAVIDGRTSHKDVKEILKVFNSIANTNGKQIQVLIGSSVLSESITLYRIRHLHILSPFWNYGQVKQSIGRGVRIGSHDGLLDKTINVYLHAAYAEENFKGKDIDIWETAYRKKVEIDKKLDKLKIENKVENIVEKISVPEVDNNLVIKINEWVWDLRNCFEQNKFKISWCRVYKDKAIGYNIENNTKIIGNIPDYIKINTPLKNGYTVWRSCIDNKLRLSYIDEKVNKFTKRGKLLANVNINKIAKDLNCGESTSDIINTLKKENRYFDKQIEYDLQQY
uniref:S.kluyveri linear plasmid pSKL DNA for open reading frames 1-10 n=1 Tax=Lachancea kluyveri TaxID=4934 RepID=Q04332_LACKL|nr:unnamed protein product [Lachancea kluyveri]prf//1712308D ORF 4 [Lachancea kluyveri]